MWVNIVSKYWYPLFNSIYRRSGNFRIKNKNNLHFQFLCAVTQAKIIYYTSNYNQYMYSYMPSYCDYIHHIPESVCRLCIDRLLKYCLVTLILQPLSRLTKHIQNCSHLSPCQYTPLHEAAASGHIDTVQYLVYKGAEINIKSNDGVSEWTVMLIRVWVPRYLTKSTVNNCETSYMYIVSLIPC